VDGEGWALALHLYPDAVEQVMSVSDAGLIMPPKSTWFEPKLRSGLFVHPVLEATRRRPEAPCAMRGKS